MRVSLPETQLRFLPAHVATRWRPPDRSSGVRRPYYTNVVRAGAAGGTGEPGWQEEFRRLLQAGNTAAQDVGPAEGDRPAVRSERAAAELTRAGSVQDQVLVPAEKILLAADVLPP